MYKNEIQENIKLSRYQLPFWLEWKLDPASAKYNTPLLYHINGKLNIPALSQALSAYVNDFHCSLRYCFHTNSDAHLESSFNVGDKFAIALEAIPLISINQTIGSTDQKSQRPPTSDVPQTHQAAPLLEDSSINQYIRSFCKQAFAAMEPLYKVELINVGDHQYLLLLNFHHVATDAFSAQYITQTLTQLYNHYAWGKPAPIPPTVLLNDFVKNEQLYYPSVKETADLRYWQEKLNKQPLRVHFLPNQPPIYNETVTTNETLPNDRGHSFYFTLDESLTSEIKKFTKQQTSTPFILLSAIFALTLSRYTQQKTIVLTYPVNIRPSQLQGVPGCFVNNIPFIVDFNSLNNFYELIQQCTLERKENKQHSLCTLTSILHTLNNHRPGISSGNAFNVSIVESFLNIRPLEFEGVEVTPLKHNREICLNDLILYYELGTELNFRIDYSLKYFDTSLIEQFSKQFMSLLSHCLTYPEGHLFQFPIIQQQEEEKIELWNQTTHTFPEDKNLCELFHTQLKKTPENKAIIYQNKSITYRMLDLESTKMAEYILKFMPKRPATQPIIALCMERGIEFVISLFAILKTGAVFLPVDILDAPARIEYKLKNAAVTLVITSSKIHTKFPSLNRYPIVLFDKMLLNKNFKPSSEDNTRDPSHPPSGPALTAPSYPSSNLAYVIYTSGSTGHPKGVMVEHKSLINLFFSLKEKWNLSERDRFLSLSSLAFDTYYLELFLPLLTGGQHILCPEASILDPQQFIQTLKKTDPTFIHATPSFWSMVVPFLKKEDCHFTISTGGEALHQNLAQKLMMLAKNVWNLYGPTETTICSTFYQLQTNSAVFIGRGFANTQLEVLDEFYNRVPIGTAGELCISGEGLSQGYLNDQLLTNTQFVHHPITQKRIYKTGDQVRWHSTGFIQYLGRSDLQRKIRGHRISLVEIEQALLCLPEIQQVKVDIIESTTDQTLIAYYLLKKPSILDRLFKTKITLTPSILIKHLKKSLPPPMIPAAFLRLDHFPLTLNGKLDITKLPSPNESHYVTQPNYLKPLDAIELKLLQLWTEVLEISKISVHDDFLQIGGNSLRAVSLMAKINHAFQLHCPVAWLIENNHIRAQAHKIRTERTALHYQSIVHFNRSFKKPALFLIHPAFAGAEVYSELARLLNKDIPLYALESYNLNSGRPFIKNIETLAHQYVDNILTIQPHGPYYLGGWSLGGLFAYEIAQQLIQKGETVNTLYLLDTKIYAKEYLTYLENKINLNSVVRKLPEMRGKFLKTLPKTQLDHLLASLKNDIQLLKNYQLKPYSGRAFMIKTQKKSHWGFSWFANKHNGFKPYLPHLKMMGVDSDHMNLIEGEQVKELVRLLEQDILQHGGDE